MDIDAPRAMCEALTKSGQPCKNHVLPGARFCRLHQVNDSRTAEAIPAAAAQHGAPHPDGAEPCAAPAAGSLLGTSVAEGGPVYDPAIQQRLAGELEALIHRVRSTAAGYTPPAFSASGLVRIIQENLEKLSPDSTLGALEHVRAAIADDLLNLDTWKGIWFVIHYSLELQAAWLKRRLLGEYQTDDWGLDWDFVEALRPFMEFMYRVYWRVETTGLEHVPSSGRALLVANHSGQLPWDGVMIGTAVLSQHPAGRLVRNLYATWFPTLPFFSAMLVKMGQALATVDNGQRLLEQDQLVGVYPEGYKGVGKLYSERYRLARFGRGGFIKMAMQTGAPIIPISVVGAEETYIAMAQSPAIAKLLGFPYFPITPLFPWFGLLGFIPLPTKWHIDIGAPIPMDAYGPAAAENQALVSQLSDQVRNVVQQQIYVRLAQRRSIFFG